MKVLDWYGVCPMTGALEPQKDGVWLYREEVEKLTAAVEYATIMLATVTSADGSGHADLARTVLVKAGYSSAEATTAVDEYVTYRIWGPK